MLTPPASVRQKQKVDQLADQLDNLENRIGQLDEDYGAAQDRKAELDQEIAESQAKIAQQQGRLDELSGVLGDIAVDKYVSGSALELSPLFSNAAAYSEAEQKDSLSRLALDSGSGSTDEMLALAEDLAKEQASLDRKQQQVADLVATLDAKMTEAEALQAEYTQKLSSAQADLGVAIEQERERRAEAAAAAEIAKQQQAAAAASAAAAANTKSAAAAAAAPRGGGTGGGSSGGGAAPAAPDPSTGGGGGGGGDPHPGPVGAAGLVDGRDRRQRRAEPARCALSIRCRVALASRSTARVSRSTHGVKPGCTCLISPVRNTGRFRTSRRARCSQVTSSSTSRRSVTSASTSVVAR